MRATALVAAVVAALIGGSLLTVDDSFVRRSVSCDLRSGAGCFADPTALEPSAIGLTRWRAGVDLVATLGPLAPGDVLKLALCAPDGPQKIALWVDDTEVARLRVDRRWRQHEVTTPTAGHTVLLRRLDDSGPGIDLSRLSVANTIGHASGVFAAAVRSDLAPVGQRRQRVDSEALLVAVPLALAILLAGLARRRDAAWSAACREAARGLAPAAVVVTLLALITVVTPYRVSCPTRTLLTAIVVVTVLTLAVSERHRLAATARRAAAALAAMLPGLVASPLLCPESWRPATARAVAAGWLLLVGSVAIMLLPRSPFEWDEMLFLQAMEHFDVPSHSPHPPGYPLFVASGRLVNALVGDPSRSLQLVSVVGALLTALGMALAMRRLGAPRAAVAMASLLLVVTPAFAFHANVGMADALATGLASLALWACAAALAAAGTGPWLVAAAAFTALAAGTRPQVGAALIGPGVWIIASAVRARRWRDLALAASTFLGVSAACWLPVVALSGWARYRRALLQVADWIARNEAAGHLPEASLDLLADAWLVRPFGSAACAGLLWALVVAGGIGWWRAGHRRVALVAALSTGGYLLVASWQLHLHTSVRYVNPALPGLAILVAGVATLRRPLLRRALIVATIVLALLQASWGAPVYLLRAREAAPVWSTLAWIRGKADPGATQVVYHGAIRPHVLHLLSDLSPAPLAHDSPQALALAGQSVWEVGPTSWIGDDAVLHHEVWSNPVLRRLSRDRYLDCAVAQRSPTAVPALTQPLPTGRWTATARQTCRLRPGSDPACLRVTAFAGGLELARGGRPVVTLATGSQAELPLAAATDERLELVPTSGRAELQTDLVTGGGALGAAAQWLVPAVAHAAGYAGGSWQSDLELSNSSHRVASCRLTLLPGGDEAAPPTSALLPVPAGGRLVLRDVVALVFAAQGSGAVAVAAGGPAHAGFRTKQDKQAPGRRWSVALPAAAAASLVDAEHPGAVDLPHADDGSPTRLNLGVANPGATAASVVAAAEVGALGGVRETFVTVPPRSYRTLSLPAAWRGARLSVRVTPPGAQVLAHVSVVEQQSGRWSFLPLAPSPARAPETSP